MDHPFVDAEDQDRQGGKHGSYRLARNLGALGLITVGIVTVFSLTRHTNTPIEHASMATNLAAEPSPAMKHFPQIADMNIPKMAGAGDSNSYFLDIALSTVPGKEMAGGLYRLDAGPTLTYTYTYEEFKFIVDGEFHLTDGTGQKVVAKKGDLMYFPRGTKVIFDTPETATGYFIGQRTSPESGVDVDAVVRAAIASNPAMQLFPQFASDLSQIPLLPNTDGSKSYLQDLAWSNVPGKEMAAGLYHEEAGPTLHYTYTYEELKYIVGGEFHLTDGTGQKVVAKHGDLMYFPKGSQIQFETPQFALGFFCGQRKGGEA